MKGIYNLCWKPIIFIVIPMGFFMNNFDYASFLNIVASLLSIIDLLLNKFLSKWKRDKK